MFSFLRAHAAFVETAGAVYVARTVSYQALGVPCERPVKERVDYYLQFRAKDVATGTQKAYN